MSRVVTMNVSLPPGLDDQVRSRVESGAYASASEVVREALRFHELLPGLLMGALSRQPQSHQPGSERDQQELTRLHWKELRHALLTGERVLRDSRAKMLGELFATALAVEQARLKTAMPDATEEERAAALALWLRGKSGENLGQDYDPKWERPASSERLEALLGGSK